ncbi:hypothetical protein IV203_036230 [Nitzschia inconspicua]|uniref:Uncharacterized protein n=1 Tax=Nitzschia inconspicua TaxID=303405 RepID=A0A9K3LES3_9STRA|nr:hypothetical protein IV203_036230 [Nitzschia inconspicua]
MADKPQNISLTAREFLYLGLDLTNKTVKSESLARDRFMAHYGTEPIVVAVMWEMLIDDGWTKKKRGCKPKHLLFALKFKKSYDAEMITALALGVDEKTYRKWVWFMIEGIAQLKTLVIRLAHRFKKDSHQKALMVVDGVDFEIKEPLSLGFSSAWFSHKFKGPGVRYELATCINTGDIVWFHGPFPCGSHPDLKIFRLGLKKHLLQGERCGVTKDIKGT